MEETIKLNIDKTQKNVRIRLSIWPRQNNSDQIYTLTENTKRTDKIYKILLSKTLSIRQEKKTFYPLQMGNKQGKPHNCIRLLQEKSFQASSPERKNQSKAQGAP